MSEACHGRSLTESNSAISTEYIRAFLHRSFWIAKQEVVSLLQEIESSIQLERVEYL